MSSLEGDSVTYSPNGRVRSGSTGLVLTIAVYQPQWAAVWHRGWRQPLRVSSRENGIPLARCHSLWICSSGQVQGNHCSEFPVETRATAHTLQHSRRHGSGPGCMLTCALSCARSSSSQWPTFWDTCKASGAQVGSVSNPVQRRCVYTAWSEGTSPPGAWAEPSLCHLCGLAPVCFSVL